MIAAAAIIVAGACAGGKGAEASSVLVTDTGDTHPLVRARLAAACVEAAHKQALTVQAVDSTGGFYSSTYADGQPGREPPHGPGYGGEGVLHLDEGEEEQVSWAISKDAPPGIVVVYVDALPTSFESVDPDEASRLLRLSYLLMGPDEECPEGEPTIRIPKILTDTGDAEPRVRASLAKACVQAGDRQALTVRGDPGAVTYNTIYANGENGRPSPNGGGYGGSGWGIVDQEGETELGWTIKEGAPPGVAVVLVRVSTPGGQGTKGTSENEQGVRLELAFRVTGSGEACS